MTTLPDHSNESLIAWLRSHNLGTGCGPGAALSAFRHDLTTLLAQAAAGRREYAVNAPDDQAAVLEQQACDLDMVARLVGGDMTVMTGWLPSWRWTDDMMPERVVRHVEGCSCLERDGAVLNVDLRCDIP